MGTPLGRKYILLYSYMEPLGASAASGLQPGVKVHNCTFARGVFRLSGPPLFPQGSKDPNKRVLGPKYYTINGIWALKNYYMGPWTLRVPLTVTTAAVGFRVVRFAKASCRDFFAMRRRLPEPSESKRGLHQDGVRKVNPLVRRLAVCVLWRMSCWKQPTNMQERGLLDSFSFTVRQ